MPVVAAEVRVSKTKISCNVVKYTHASTVNAPVPNANTAFAGTVKY